MQRRFALIFAALLISACSSKPTTPAPESDSPTVKALIRYQYGKGEITKLCESAIAEATAQLVDLPEQVKETKALGVLSLENIMSDFDTSVSPLTFMSSVSTDAKLRLESDECQKKVSAFWIATFARRDLYDMVKESRAASPAERRLKKETLIAFEKQGLKASDKVSEEVKGFMQKLADLQTTFGSNLDNDTTTVAMSDAELEGTPADFRSRLKKDGQGFSVVTTKYPDYLAVMENAVHPEARKKMLTAFLTRQAAPNTKLLEEALLLRQKVAAKLGYATWADYQIQGRMAKSSGEVLDFLNNLRTKLAAASKRDQAKLLAMKKEKDPAATKLDPWDVAYYEYQLKKRDYTLDDEKIREYFPADRVTEGTFAVYSKLLGVEFVRVPKAKVWHPEVRLYEVRDAKTKNLLAYFFADLIPREGKYGHAAAFQLVSGRIRDGAYVKPVAAVVANFQPPSGGKPSLLNHDEVETFFHEFGHIMHQTLTKADYGSLSGAAVARDFVEAPSQMLENWVWDKEILGSLSGHYKDLSQKLPDDLLQKMIEVRYFNKGYFYTRQLVLGLYDMKIHTLKGAVDSKKVYDDLYRQLLGMEPLKEGYFPASFGHLMGGYDAGYYGYLWSEVYARDMFTRFEKEGLLSEKVGADYRKYILERGGMEEPKDLLAKFLGRPASSQAFLKMLDTKVK